jgi:hypothetical protein
MIFQTYIQAEIIEVNSFDEITKYVADDTLVILDIDDTLLIPVQTLGTDVWFCDRHARHKATLPPEEALDRALAEWEGIRHLTEVKLVEPSTNEVVAELQKTNVVMGLTTQGLALATRTEQQLKKLGIDLRRSAPSQEDYYFINQHGVLYRAGILFTSGTPKGPALMKLLNQMDYHPKRVVFINDKKTHLADVEKSMDEAGIEFIGLRYGFSDDRVKNYNYLIAEIQWTESSFDHILSDEEAAKQIYRICEPTEQKTITN